MEWPAEERPRKLIYAPHWYDLQSLHRKALSFWSANVQALAHVSLFGRCSNNVSLLSPRDRSFLTPWCVVASPLAESRELILSLQYFGREGLKRKYGSVYSPQNNLELNETPCSYMHQIRNIINAGYRSIGELPTVIGETGVPFDLNGGAAFRTGDFQWQERQMDAICSALESSLVSFKCAVLPSDSCGEVLKIPDKQLVEL